MAFFAAFYHVAVNYLGVYLPPLDVLCEKHNDGFSIAHLSVSKGLSALGATSVKKTNATMLVLT